MPTLTENALKKVITYNPLNGVFTWKLYHRKNSLLGQKAGSINVSGMRYIHVFGEKYRASRLAILYITGSLPEYAGHKDKNPGNLKFNNLYSSDTPIKTQYVKKPKNIHKKPDVNHLIMFCTGRSTQNLGLKL